MKTFLKLLVGLVIAMIIVFNLSYNTIGEISFKNLSLGYIENIVNANSENPCSGGGISGYDEDNFLCGCGIWTTGCLSMYNYCCGVSDNCDELCDDIIITTSYGH